MNFLKFLRTVRLKNTTERLVPIIRICVCTVFFYNCRRWKIYTESRSHSQPRALAFVKKLSGCIRYSPAVSIVLNSWIVYQECFMLIFFVTDRVVLITQRFIFSCLYKILFLWLLQASRSYNSSF